MVKMAEPLLFGTGMQEVEGLIDVERMRRERSERLRKFMKKHDIAVCLMMGLDNVRYAIGAFCPPLAGQFYCLFSVEKDPVLWDLAGWYHQLKDRMHQIKPEYYRPSRISGHGAVGPEATREQMRLFAAEIKEVLQEQGLQGEKLGVIGFDGYAMRALKEAGITTIDAWEMMLEARAVKTKDEISCLKMAASIADGAFYVTYEALKPGVRDIDVKAAVLKYICENGGVTNETVPVFSGPHTWPRAIPNTDRIINTGDMVYVDIAGMSYMGYRTCIYRNFIVGRKPTQKEKDWHQQVLDKQIAAIAEIKPGATTADVAKHFTPASEWGYDENEAYSLDVGHGIGLVSYEYPCVSRRDSFDYPVVFEAGNVLTIETVTGEWRVGGARLENMVVVTEDGAEIIDRTPMDEIIVAGAMM